MKLFVFDLDFTIWDAAGTWCDATRPPYFWEDGKLHDQDDNWIRLYDDVVHIFEELKQKNKKIVAASRTSEPGWAQDLLHQFDIDKYFDWKEIYPSSKVLHFQKIKNHFQVPHHQMVFFDDEYRNIEEVRPLGVRTVFVRNGITFSDVETYL
jgi:magnesium-dependent phosphatase 1